MKAFGSVLYWAVIQGAIYRGFRGRCLKYIPYFLTDRTFSVNVGEVEGKNKHLTKELLQGAIISTTLFNYANGGLCIESR